MPERLRWYLDREPHAVSAVLHIFLRVIEAHVRASIPTGSPRARLGAVGFVHRFGSALNRHVHLHCCIIDGLFDPGEDGQFRFLQAPVLTTAEMAAITEQVRRGGLRWFARSGLLEPEEARDMLGREHGGFSPDAAVRIAGQDRAGLERRLRYCARPAFALERLEQINPHQLIYHLPKPRPDGRTTLVLTPLGLIDALAALIPPPRRHRHRYHGVLAPNLPLRAAVAADGREEAPSPQAPAKTVSATDEEPTSGSPARDQWAMLLARLFASLPLVCPNCGANMRIIAFVTDAAPVEQILLALGEPPRPPADRPPGTRHPSRHRTGTWPLSPSPSSNSIRVSPGSRRLLWEAVPSAFVVPPSGMTPSPLQRAASACNGRRATSARHVFGP